VTDQVVVTRNLGIFAGGRGTRMFGPTGGNKALFRLSGRPLVDYVLDAAVEAGVMSAAVVCSVGDEEIKNHIYGEYSRLLAIDFLEVESSTTLEPVATLLQHFSDVDHYLSTCDIVCPPGTLVDLGRYATRVRSHRASLVFLASKITDSHPIWMRTGEDGRVLEYGKEIPPTGEAFASLRWCAKGLWREASSMIDSTVRTDTHLMSRLVATRKVEAFSLLVDDVMDVDTTEDALLAEELVRNYVRNYRGEI
jgi:NDP-sugar pyrophosphorylase family protein